MPLDPQALTVIERRDASIQPPLGPDASLADRRERFNQTWREPGPEVGSVEDRLLPGPRGDIPVRIYTPSGSGPFPILMLFHGGGFVFGNIDTYDGNARRICVGVDCVVVSVEYRVAPENKFPAAPEDCYSTILWAAENAASINGDARRIAVCGDSAGGNLSTVVCMMARDKSGPEIRFQSLRCPVTHRNFEPLTIDRELTPVSSRDWWWKQYLADEADAENPYASPMASKDLAGLPPALIITAEYDELRDEGEAYAQMLQEAGVPATCVRYEGMFHVFHMYPAYIHKAKEALEQEFRMLRDAFAG
jgi:acetyl esterase